jgi:hypothetical protein
MRNALSFTHGRVPSDELVERVKGRRCDTERISVYVDIAVRHHGRSIDIDGRPQGRTVCHEMAMSSLPYTRRVAVVRE